MFSKAAYGETTGILDSDEEVYSASSDDSSSEESDDDDEPAPPRRSTTPPPKKPRVIVGGIYCRRCQCDHPKEEFSAKGRLRGICVRAAKCNAGLLEMATETHTEVCIQCQRKLELPMFRWEDWGRCIDCA